MATIGAPAGRATRTGQVSWAAVDSPVGPLLVAASSHGIVRLDFGADHVESFVHDLASRLPGLVVESTARLDPVRRQLEEYFAGRRRTFELTIDWSLTTEFQQRVLEATARVPYGETTSYGALAATVDRPGGARAVGGALGANPVAIVVPCHRVVRSTGHLGGFGGGLDAKAWLLHHELTHRFDA